MRTGACLLRIALIWAPGLVHGQALTLQQAIESAEANNRAIRAARLERAKALNGVNVARTYCPPAFSVAALGSQSLAHLGLTFPLGSLGVYPGIGPIPGKSTTLKQELRVLGDGALGGTENQNKRSSNSETILSTTCGWGQKDRNLARPVHRRTQSERTTSRRSHLQMCRMPACPRVSSTRRLGTP